MIDYNKPQISSRKVVGGKGLFNSLINNLPVELHLPGGYQYCGPGTKLQKRLARGDPGINQLDKACKEHDISYSKFKNTSDRTIADKILAEKAWQRALASDSNIAERSNALLVTAAMKLKNKLGMGVKRGLFRKAVRSAKQSIIKRKPENEKSAIKIARAAVKSVIKKKSSAAAPRIIPVPKIGGILPFLIPLFAGLSAVGALSGGAAGIAKAVNDAKKAKENFEESKRHNKTMESIALGKGLYLKPYKQGYGLYLKPYPKNF